MTISVYTIADPGRELKGPYGSIDNAVKDCACYDTAIIFVDGELLVEMVGLGLEIRPSSIEQALLGHVGYIDNTPVVTDKFTAQQIIPREWSRGVYVSFPHTK